VHNKDQININEQHQQIFGNHQIVSLYRKGVGQEGGGAFTIYSYV